MVYLIVIQCCHQL